MSSPSLQVPPDHLNRTGCEIRYTEGKGRGVFATRAIAKQTTVEISPVLLFSKDEYETHGQHTLLDDYTFKWPDGRMALALGLGSLFNHSRTPNVSYTRDSTTESIQYATARDISAGEELSIFYGHNLWFDPVDAEVVGQSNSVTEVEDGWGGLSVVDDLLQVFDPEPAITCPFTDGDPDELVPDDQLPFTRYKLPPDEEDLETIRTYQAWVVDIPDARQITTMLKWLKQSGLDAPNLGHLKRIRKHAETITLLLTTHPAPPELPEGQNLSEPYLVSVPVSPALTPTSWTLKSSIWPTVFAPPRKGEEEGWSRGKARWAWEAMRVTVQDALQAKADGELPIVAHVPVPYEARNDFPLPQPFTARDTRTSTSHPLRHATINVVRKVADHRASASSTQKSTSDVPPTLKDGDSPANGSNYLLTGTTLFITHEPCIMCSMALLHSRLKEVIYLLPMAQTGGCGGLTCLPVLKGVNHRFGIGRWKEGAYKVCQKEMSITPTIDA